MRKILSSTARFAGSVLLVAADLLGIVLVVVGRWLRRQRPPAVEPFRQVQDLVNRVVVRDGEIRDGLTAALSAMTGADKDRLVEVLVMTLRCEAKRELVRRRALAVLGYRLSQVGDRLYRFSI